MKKPLLACIVAAVVCTTAFGWNKPGHMLTGSIAYLELKATSPAAVTAAVALLKEHQAYPVWKASITAQHMRPEQADEYLFMMAARWPDDARGTSEHRESWHYVNLPLTYGSTDGLSIPSTASGDLLTQIETNLTVLRSSAPARDRAKALSWILHMGGDIHQPLHSVALFSKEQAGWRDGDRGGNQFYVKPGTERAVMKLHALWDGIAIGSERAQTVRTAARRLRGERESSGFASALAGGWNPTEWANESKALAKAVVYEEDGSRIPGDDDEHAPTKALTATYLEQAGDTGEERICLAGYRLAAMMKSTF